MDTKTMKAAVIDVLEEIKAKNIVALNVSKLTSLFDYLVVATGDSNRQTRALANNVKERLKERGAKVYGSEGEDTGEWVLVDLGDIVVHVMQPAIRDYYTLEELWREGKIEYPKPAAKKTAPAGDAPPVSEAAKAAGKSTAATGKSAGAGKTAKSAKTGVRKISAAGAAAKKPRTAAKTAKTAAGGAKTRAKTPAEKAAAGKPAAKKPAAKRTRNA